jgi:hypothetical protein
LVNYWPFNGNFSDVVGGGTLTPSGTVTFIPDRYNNASKAAYINGGYLSLPSQAYVTGPAFSLMGWININDTTLYRGIFMLGNAGVDVVYFSTVYGGVYGNVYNGSSYATSYIPSPANLFGVNSWTHTAFTFNGSRITYYVNGTAYPMPDAVYSPQNVVRTNCYFGVFSWTPSGNTGVMKLDDFRIYNGSLNASQIQAIMKLS